MVLPYISLISNGFDPQSSFMESLLGDFALFLMEFFHFLIVVLRALSLFWVQALM